MATNTNITDQSSGSGSQQFLTFRLAQEEYGVPILRVQEIKGYSAVTPIPNSPSHVRGVMNLRGAVMPVLDLRSRFGMEQADTTKFTVIVVVNVAKKIVGLVVDAVNDVLDCDSKSIEPCPSLGSDVDTSFLTGMAKQGDRLVALLDLERVFGVEATLAA